MTTIKEIVAAARDHGLSLEGFRKKTANVEDCLEAFKKDPYVIDQVDRARNWIRRFQTRKTLNRNATSSTFATRIGIETGGEISNGAFLIACVLEQVTIKQVAANSLNGWTNLSFKRIGEPEG